MGSEYEYLVKLLVLGDGGVGKTSFLGQYADGVFSSYSSTVGIDFKEKHVLYDSPNNPTRRVHLQLWDTAGQERFRSLTTAFFRDSMGFILMFDVTHDASFVHVRTWLDQLRKNAGNDDVDVVLCGNKADLADQEESGTRRVSEQRAREFAKHHGMPYFETSAATGNNVDACVQKLLEMVMTRMGDAVEKHLKGISVLGKKNLLPEPTFAGKTSGCSAWCG